MQKATRAAFLLCLLAALWGCETDTSASTCSEPAQLIGVPEQWNAQEVVVLTIEWHVTDPENPRVECGGAIALGCTVYGPEWPEKRRVAIAAADPIAYGWDSATGRDRTRTLGHETLHGARGRYHPVTKEYPHEEVPHGRP